MPFYLLESFSINCVKDTSHLRVKCERPLAITYSHYSKDLIGYHVYLRSRATVSLFHKFMSLTQGDEENRTR